MSRWTKSFGLVAVAAAGLIGLNEIDPSDRKILKRKTKHLINQKKSKEERVNEVVNRWMVVSGIPGLAVGVSVDGKNVFSQGYGYCDVENNTRCLLDAVMRIASISKTFAATITAKLVEENKIDLDKSIYTYVPEFPKKKWEGKEVDITVRQLLSHRGGIRHYYPLPEDRKNDGEYLDDLYSSYGESHKTSEMLLRKPFKSTADAVALFKDDDLTVKPGTFNYTTHGFALLAACLEKASGKSYTKLVTELFQELGMYDSFIDVNQKIIPNRSKFYRRNRNHELVNVPEVDVSYKYAGGGLLSTSPDLLKYANVLLASSQGKAGSYLKPSTMKLFWNHDNETDRFKDFYALGWCHSVQKSDRSGYWYHTGAATGASSVLLIQPTLKGKEEKTKLPKGICVCILVNVQEVYTNIVGVAAEIADIYNEDTGY